MSDTKEAARQLLTLARERKVRFPSIWDETKLFQTCGATIVLHRNDTGSFDMEGAIDDLISKYGSAPIESPVKGKGKGTKRKKDDEDEEAEEKEADDEDEGEEGGKKKKQKKPKAPPKTSVVAEESNRKVAEAVKEMADIYFKNKDMRKAAKAIRECETPITTAKEAMALKGIGKGIAGYIDEFLQTGEIQKLEELRAGIA
eukprot:gene10274-11175_t